MRDGRKSEGKGQREREDEAAGYEVGNRPLMAQLGLLLLLLLLWHSVWTSVGVTVAACLCHVFHISSASSPLMVLSFPYCCRCHKTLHPPIDRSSGKRPSPSRSPRVRAKASSFRFRTANSNSDRRADDSRTLNKYSTLLSEGGTERGAGAATIDNDKRIAAVASPTRNSNSNSQLATRSFLHSAPSFSSTAGNDFKIPYPLVFLGIPYS
ncbi:uncharacterized protein LOC117577735 isoform X2 [Drosophila albomicans]|uniref:Uncharacterized protein LOC117577735 isoform X2 n=1 Tax=Drosophila albomicans TaxID=7291 RepID=A0A6P8XPI7_DROAB|nr:uncharacterized protein LOC117577735 isoform X2 [Drosophila albomicans]